MNDSMRAISLTNKHLFKKETDFTSIKRLIEENEKTFFDEIQRKIVATELEMLQYPKHKESCFNHVEYYQYMKKDGPVQIMVQKIRDVSKYTQFLKVYKKTPFGEWSHTVKPINVNHSDCYAEGSNICTIFEGQYMFFFRIGNEKQNKQKFFVSLYRYNFETETEKPINVIEINGQKGTFVEAVKFITKPQMKSKIDYIENDKKARQHVSILDLYDACFLYRNEDLKDACKFEIRTAKNLKNVKFSLDLNEEWVNIGGYKGWASYNFPCFKMEQEEARRELDIKSEMVIICLKKSIVLSKLPDGNYRLLKDIPFEAMQILDHKRQMIEKCFRMNYKIIEDNVITERSQYSIELPFVDKNRTVSIINNVDQRQIKIMELEVLEDYFKYTERVIDDTFQTEQSLQEIDPAKPDLNKALVYFHPMPDQQIILQQHLRNIIYLSDIKTESGRIGIIDYERLIEDESLQIYENHFKIPMLPTEYDASNNLRRGIHASHPQTVFIQKSTFVQTQNDLDQDTQRIFVLKHGKPEIKKCTTYDREEYTDQMLFMIQEKTVFAHSDRSIVPILLVETEGKYDEETQFKNIWLALLDIRKVKIIKSSKLLYRCPPNLVSCQSVAQSFHLAMSSKTSFLKEDSDIIHRQNYHILNVSSEMYFNEVLEYQVDYIIDKFNQQKDTRVQMIGIAALITTEKFDYQDVALYPLFDEKNKVVGSQIIFGCNQEKDIRNMTIVTEKEDLVFQNDQTPKLIFKIQNPSDSQEQFEQYFLTQAMKKNFQATSNTLDNRALLTQIHYNELRIKNHKIFTESDKRFGLYDALALSLNYVSNDINHIFDRQIKMQVRNITNGYAPHLQTQVMSNQNIMNISCVNPFEFKKILDLVEYPSLNDSYARSNIELILRSDTSKRTSHFQKHNILLNPKMMISTMDQNFMSVLAHSLNENAKMSTQLIFEYMFRQKFDRLNYDLVMMNLNHVLDRQCGSFLIPFLTYSPEQTLSLELVQDGTDLEHYQKHPKIKYENYDQQRDISQIDENFRKMYDGKKSNSEAEKNQRVKYCYIDFRPLLFQNKLEYLKNERDQNEIPRMNQINFNKIVQKMIKQTPDELQYQQILRVLIDDQFHGQTQLFFAKQLALYIFGQYIPAIVIVFKEDDFIIWNLAGILIQSITLGYFVQLESHQYNVEKINYYDNVWNIVDIFYYTFTAIQIITRSFMPASRVVPHTNEEDQDIVNFSLIIINFFVMVSSTMKVLSLLRFLKNIGNLVQLLISCLQQIGGFLIFLSLFIFQILTLYKMVGADFQNTGNYQDVNQFFRFLLQTIQNSIGDIITPQYSLWDRKLQEHPGNVQAIFMISLIWIIFITLNMVVLTTVLMNCLIAIIGQSYQEVMLKPTNHSFSKKSTLNLESATINSDPFKTFDTVYIAFNEFNEEQAPCELVDTIRDMQQKIIRQVSIDNEKRDQRRKYQFDNMEHNMQEQMKVLHAVLAKIGAQERRDIKLAEKIDELSKQHAALKEEIIKGEMLDNMPDDQLQ